MSFLVKRKPESLSHHETKEHRNERFNKNLPMNAIYDPSTRKEIKIYNEVTGYYEKEIHCVQCELQLELRCMKHNLPLKYDDFGWKNCIEKCSTMCCTYYAPENKGCVVCKHWTEKNLDEKPEDVNEDEIEDKLEITQEIIHYFDKIHRQLKLQRHKDETSPVPYPKRTM